MNIFRLIYKNIFLIILFFIASEAKAQLFTQGNSNEFASDPIEKTKKTSLKTLFDDRRFDAGFLLYLNFFSDLNIVALENPKIRIYKPAISKRLLNYTLDNLAEVNETVIQDYFDRGLARIDSGKYDEAMNDFDKSLLYDPENADAYINRGVLFIYSNQYPEALEELQKAEKFDPKNAGVFFNRALVFYKQGNYAGAIIELDQCLKLDPEYTRAYFQKGVVLDAQGNSEEALKTLKKARSLGDTDAGPYIRKIQDRNK
jgi:tetratricopeptide (TPR) repeat protein